MLHDAARAIGEIRSCWPIAVITDGPVISQSRKCEALGLPGVAAQIVLTGMWGDKFHKPQTAAFELVASRIKAAKYVYVADNPAKDFTAPKQLGWYSVRIRRKGGLHYDKDNDSVMPDLGLPDCADLGTVLSYIASERRQWASI
jgi:putative hydrolase of the HAD superfamily